MNVISEHRRFGAGENEFVETSSLINAPCHVIHIIYFCMIRN